MLDDILYFGEGVELSLPQGSLGSLTGIVFQGPDGFYEMSETQTGGGGPAETVKIIVV
jgi:hypothetical protein